jgi:hypothetical protein
MLVFVLSELKLLQGGGNGMMLINLKEGVEVVLWREGQGWEGG